MADESRNVYAYWREKDGAWFRLADDRERAQRESERRFHGQPGLVFSIPLDLLRERIRGAT